MKKITLTIVFLFLLFAIKSQNTFQYIYTGGAPNVGTSGCLTSDGGYIINGEITVGSSNIYLIKINPDGSVAWSKSYDMSITGSVGNSIQQTNDGGYIITGAGSGAPSLLLKIDNIGNIMWKKTYTSSTELVKQTMDGGYIIVGTAGGSGFGISVIKTDNNGNTTWTKNYSRNNSLTNYGYYIQQTSDYGYIVLGKTDTVAASSGGDIYFIKLDSLGNKIWSKTYGGTGDDYANYVKQTIDGGYIITGETYPNATANYTDIFLLKTDSVGNMNWVKTYGGIKSDAGSCVYPTINGDYIITGYTESFPDSVTNSKLFLIKTNSTGNIIWMKIYGGGAWCSGNSVFGASDGGYIIIGNKSSIPAGAYLIKTDSLGNSGCLESIVTTTTNTPSFTTIIPNDTITTSVTDAVPTTYTSTWTTTLNTLCYVGINELIDILDIEIFPNPFTSQTTISFSEQQMNTTIKIKDILGKEMKSINFTGKQCIIEKGEMRKGIYFVNITYENKKIINKKIVIQ